MDSRIRYEPVEDVAGCYLVFRDGFVLGKAYKVTSSLWGGTCADGMKLPDLRPTRAEVVIELERLQPRVGRVEPGRLRRRILAKRAAERELAGRLTTT